MVAKKQWNLHEIEELTTDNNDPDAIDFHTLEPRLTPMES